MTPKTFNQLKDEKGQVSFADAVFFDLQMPVDQKLYWLRECAELPSEDDRKDAAHYLDILCRVCGDPVCVGDYAHFL